METPQPSPQPFTHEAALYGSDQEFLDMVAPFLAAGIARGEPTLLGVGQRQEQLLRDALGDPPELISMARDGRASASLNRLRHTHDTLTAHLAGGASRVRAVGDVVHDDAENGRELLLGAEAAANSVLAHLPVWVLCTYDRRTTPEPAPAEITRTHRYLASANGQHLLNESYTEPAELLDERARAYAEPLERRAPDLAMTDPSLADARLAVATMSQATALDEDTVYGLIFAVNEALTNAQLHGVGPVLLRGWLETRRAHFAVRDAGAGPADRCAGYLPARGEECVTGGGLWLSRQMCPHLTSLASEHGYTVYLMATTGDITTGRSTPGSSTTGM